MLLFFCINHHLFYQMVKEWKKNGMALLSVETKIMMGPLLCTETTALVIASNA